jgi:hypothetical protein
MTLSLRGIVPMQVVRLEVNKVSSTRSSQSLLVSRDVSMGVSAGLFSNRDKQRANLKATGKYTDAQINDYFARTDATIARNAAEAAARSNRSDDSPSAITPPPQDVFPPEEQYACLSQSFWAADTCTAEY